MCMYMCVCVCSYVCVAAFDWQHTQDAPDGAPSVRDESICLQGSNMCSVLHFYLWRSCSSHAAIPFFFWKENGLWKAIQQQQQQQRELLWKILSSEKKIWNVHYSWQIFALTFCFLSVNFCLTRFLFFMFYSHSACSWQLGWHAPPPVYPLPLMTFPVFCQPASQPDCMFD